MLATLLLAWHAFSPLALALGATGGLLLAVAALGLFALPGWLSRPAIVAGAGLLSAGLLYQTAYARATHAAELRIEREAAAAERARAERAEAITQDLERRAERDRAVLADSERKLQELTDALATHADRDRGCLDRDLARRLRNL